MSNLTDPEVISRQQALTHAYHRSEGKTADQMVTEANIFLKFLIGEDNE